MFFSRGSPSSRSRLANVLLASPFLLASTASVGKIPLAAAQEPATQSPPHSEAPPPEPPTTPASPETAPPPAAASPPAPASPPAAPEAVHPSPPAGPSPEQLAAIRKRVTEANVQTAGLLSQLASLDSQIYQINQTILDGERQAADLHKRIEASGEEVLRLQMRREELGVLWNKRARRIYKDSPGTTWAPFFSAQTWSDIGRLKKVWKSLAEGHVKLVAQSAQVKEQLALEKADLLAASQNLAKQTEGLNAAREKLRQNRQSRTTSLGQLRLAVGKAMAEQQAALAAEAVGMRIPHLCNPGSPVQNARLADLLDWYAPGAGPEPFAPPKFTPTGIVWEGQASWYGPTFEGCRASSGATYRSNQMTAASLTLPFGTFLKVTNAGKSAIVVITDRGPYVRGRELDLSQAAAQAVGLPGVGSVMMEIVTPAEPAPPFP